MSRERATAARSPNVLELSMDAKAVIKVGEFSRYGVSRVLVFALDHDHGAEAKVTPYGILLTAHNELTVSLATGPVTADFIVDRIEAWWCAHRARFPEVDTLLLLQDNGPENQSRRTQFLSRIVAFAQAHRINVRLAYYPPYHSKYNPVERCWGVLEQHWNGSILDTVETVVNFAQTMTWKGVAPVVQLVTTTYAKGISLTRAAMAKVEAQVQRLAGLEAWFVEILCAPKAVRGDGAH
jgi:transposase